MVNLIKQSKSLCYKLEVHNKPVIELIHAKTRAYMFFQGYPKSE